MTDNEQEYFERMLDARFSNLDDKLNSILVQTTKTNGRVTNSEEEINELKRWRAESHGHWKAASVIGSAIGALIGLAITAWLKG